MSQPMTPMEQQIKILKRQLLHSRLRTIILFLMLACFILGGFYIKARMDEAMKTVDSIYTMTQMASGVITDISALTEDVSNTVNSVNTEELNTLISNMAEVSTALKGSVEALDVEGLNTAVTNMNEVAENLNSVASLLNGAAEALKAIFGGGQQ